MSKLMQALLSGMLITFILDFFLFLGIDTHYIKALNIDIYYNILFADNQNIFLYFIVSGILGYLLLYKSNKLAFSVIGILTLLSFSTLIEPIGYTIGKSMLMHQGVRVQTKKFSYYGDIYYDGRDRVTFYDYNFKKVLKLEKNKIIGEYK